MPRPYIPKYSIVKPLSKPPSDINAFVQKRYDDLKIRIKYYSNKLKEESDPKRKENLQAKIAYAHRSLHLNAAILGLKE